MNKIIHALISVQDKTGIVEFARGLEQLDFHILSSGDSGKLLSDNGIPFTDIGEAADESGLPVTFDGSAKPHQPGIHAGILARQDLQPIALVVMNLCPPGTPATLPDRTLAEAIDNIDISGPALVRAAARNHVHIATITHPADYPRVLAELQSGDGKVSGATRLELAKSAFLHAAAVDSATGKYLVSIDAGGTSDAFPAQFILNCSKVQDLRYGENSHQRAAFYRDGVTVPGGMAGFTQLQGKELSFNNIVDADLAWELVNTFRKPACVIVKHANPCGVATADFALAAYRLAHATDTTSASAGIIAFNRELDALTATHIITSQFVELIIAPSVSREALKVTAPKQNLRVLAAPLSKNPRQFDIRFVNGGLLVQTPDTLRVQAAQLKTVTRVQPTQEQIQDLLFAWNVAKYVKSNAVVFCRNGQTLGVGAGQMSRVDSTNIASIKAQKAGLSLDGSVVATDGPLPFRDGIDVLAAAGAKAVIQPGGSTRDEKVIAAADEHGMAMVFTGHRHFRH